MANLVPIFLAILPKLQDVLAALRGKSAALAEIRCKKLTSCFSFWHALYIAFTFLYQKFPMSIASCSQNICKSYSSCS
ncbi:hypothetical protein RQN30_05570 [Arcanobacterium hippocoleae]